jgi:hypothetical protein
VQIRRGSGPGAELVRAHLVDRRKRWFESRGCGRLHAERGRRGADPQSHWAGGSGEERARGRGLLFVERLVEVLNEILVAFQTLNRFVQFLFKSFVVTFILKQVVLQLLLVDIQLADLTLFLVNFINLLHKLFIRLFIEHVFILQVLLGLLFEGHHLFFVIAFFLLELLDVLVAFFHLILTVLNFLLQLFL